MDIATGVSQICAIVTGLKWTGHGRNFRVSPSQTWWKQNSESLTWQDCQNTRALEKCSTTRKMVLEFSWSSTELLLRFCWGFTEALPERPRKEYVCPKTTCVREEAQEKLVHMISRVPCDVLTVGFGIGTLVGIRIGNSAMTSAYFFNYWFH